MALVKRIVRSMPSNRYEPCGHALSLSVKPPFLYFTTTKVGSIAAHDAAVSSGAMAQILLWVSAFECISTVAVVQMMQGSGRKPGDFGFDPSKIYKAGNENKAVSALADMFLHSMMLSVPQSTAKWVAGEWGWAQASFPCVVSNKLGR